jgi:hypothetical protein
MSKKTGKKTGKKRSKKTGKKRSHRSGKKTSRRSSSVAKAYQSSTAAARRYNAGASGKSEAALGRAFAQAMGGYMGSSKAPPFYGPERPPPRNFGAEFGAMTLGMYKAPPKPRKPSKPKGGSKAAAAQNRTVTADSIVKEAKQAELKRWLCEGPKRSGCGAGGTRVVSGKGSFTRLRPPKFMTGKK